MSFLAPFLLIGLAAAALPIVIHLINRKRAVRQPFPAIEFLLRSEKRVAKRLKVKQLLLLLMRILLLILIPLAMAQPYLLSDDGRTASERLPTAVVLILDDSYSMGHTTGTVSAFDLAKEELLEVLDELRPWDQVALVLAHERPTAPIEDLTEDVTEVRDLLEEMTGPSFYGSDLPAALSLAAEIQATGQLPARRTIVFTDNTERAWAESDISAAEVPALGNLEIRETRSGEDLANVAISDAGFAESTAGGEDDYDIWAEVQNFSGRNIATRIDLQLDGQPVGSSIVELEPGQVSTQTFQVELAAGGLHRAEIVLSVDGADVPEDNTWFVTLNLDRQVRALLVNGDPRNVSYRDELFYLERSLGAGGSERSGIVAHIVGVDGLSADFDEFDVVVLSNVGQIPESTVAALIEYVEAGGGLLLTVGDQVDPDRYNAQFGELLPKRLRAVRELCSARDPDANLLATRLARLETSHPVFRVFDLPGGESIQSVSVYSYMLLEPSPLGSSRTLLSYGDGGPALVERQVGAGRVALLTTTIDRDWTDLPIRTAFLPFSRRLVRYLARRGTSGRDGPALVGEHYTLDVESQNPDRVTIIDPAGERFVLNPAESGSGNVSLVLERPGHYSVSLDIAGSDYEFDELMFSANLGSSESELLPASEETSADYIASAMGEAETGEGPVDIPERRVSLWPILLFVAVLLLYAESLLAVRRRMWERIRERLSPASEPS